MSQKTMKMEEKNYCLNFIQKSMLNVITAAKD